MMLCSCSVEDKIIKITPSSGRKLLVQLHLNKVFHELGIKIKHQQLQQTKAMNICTYYIYILCVIEG